MTRIFFSHLVHPWCDEHAELLNIGCWEVGAFWVSEMALGAVMTFSMELEDVTQFLFAVEYLCWYLGKVGECFPHHF